MPRLAANVPVSTVVAFVTLVVLVATNLVAIRFTNRELAPFWNAGAPFALAAGVYLGAFARHAAANSG